MHMFVCMYMGIYNIPHLYRIKQHVRQTLLFIYCICIKSACTLVSTYNAQIYIYV